MKQLEITIRDPNKPEDTKSLNIQVDDKDIKILLSIIRLFSRQ